MSKRSALRLRPHNEEARSDVDVVISMVTWMCWKEFSQLLRPSYSRLCLRRHHEILRSSLLQSDAGRLSFNHPAGAASQVLLSFAAQHLGYRFNTTILDIFLQPVYGDTSRPSE